LIHINHDGRNDHRDKQRLSDDFVNSPHQYAKGQESRHFVSGRQPGNVEPLMPEHRRETGKDAVTEL